jgi:hypothetical protein
MKYEVDIGFPAVLFEDHRIGSIKIITIIKAGFFLPNKESNCLVPIPKAASSVGSILISLLSSQGISPPKF